MNWKTQEMIDLVKTVLPDKTEVEVIDDGEYYQTNTLAIKSPTLWGETMILIFGFTTHPNGLGEGNYDDAEIENVVLRDNDSDDRGGFGSTNKILRTVGLNLELLLKEKGFSRKKKINHLFFLSHMKHQFACLVY